MFTQKSRLVPSVLAVVAAFAVLRCGGGSVTYVAADAGPSGADASPVTHEADAASDAPAPPGVRVENLTYALTSSGVTLNFVLRNGSPESIESIEAVEIQFEGDSTASKYVLDWSQAGLDSKTCVDWALAPGTSSGVIELGLDGRSAGQSTYYLLDVPCSGKSGTRLSQVYPSPIVHMSADGQADVTMRLRGLLSNGAPWSVVAQGTVRD